MTARASRDPDKRRLLRAVLRGWRGCGPGFSSGRRRRPIRGLRASWLPGISVVIPSRNGRELLASCLPLIEDADEIIVVDNGSDDGTAEFLQQGLSAALSVEQSPEPLSFRRCRESGSPAGPLLACLPAEQRHAGRTAVSVQLCGDAFDQVPDLFSSTAQIFFPEGQRREETGKTVWAASCAATDFPVRCDEPLEAKI